MFDHEQNKLLREILCVVKEIRNQLKPQLTHFEINQIVQGEITMITGINVGSSGNFVETPVPAGSVVPAGSPEVWTTDDPTITLTPSADETSVVAAVPATSTAKDFGLTFTATINGTPVSGTVRVPIIPLPPPVPTSFSIDQTA